MNSFMYEFTREILRTLSSLSGVFVGLAAVITSVSACIGLSAWRKQMLGKDEYELARRIIRATYKVRDEFIAARHPYMSSDELGRDYAANSGYVDDFKRQVACMEEALGKRMKALEAAIREMAAGAFEAEVLWGGDCKEWVRSFSYVYIDLDNSVRELVRLQLKDSLTPEESSTMAKLRPVVYLTNDKIDNVQQQVTKAVEVVESELRRHMPSKRLAFTNARTKEIE